MKKISVFDDSKLNDVATVVLNIASITDSGSWYFDQAVARTTPHRNVYTVDLMDEDKELIGELIDDYGFDLVNNVFMDLYMQARAKAEEEAEAHED